jgi:hypothetical protein
MACRWKREKQKNGEKPTVEWIDGEWIMDEWCMNGYEMNECIERQMLPASIY